MLVLASKSPRRKELLTQLGVTFISVSADIDEKIIDGESASNYVERLAIQKAQAISKQADYSDAYVLGSDTAVVIQDKILGKPQDQADSFAMLSQLSGSTHQVYTSIALVHGEKIYSQVIITDVHFKTLTVAEMQAYWLTGEPQDKAGSYGIQGIGGQFVKSINGSYSSVVGLPLYETAELLKQFNLTTLLSSRV